MCCRVNPALRHLYSTQSPRSRSASYRPLTSAISGTPSLDPGPGGHRPIVILSARRAAIRSPLGGLAAVAGFRACRNLRSRGKYLSRDQDAARGTPEFIGKQAGANTAITLRAAASSPSGHVQLLTTCHVTTRARGVVSTQREGAMVYSGTVAP